MQRNLNCQTRPVQRAAGQSAVVGAAYRAGEKLFDERREQAADFRRRSPDVREAFILAPEGAPDWATDRERLWNAAEAAERRKDGRPARDVQIGLAWELSPEEQREAVVAFARAEFVEKGHVADIAIHRYGQRVVDASEEGRETIRRWAGQGAPFLESEECRELNEPHVKIERGRDGEVQGYKLYQPHAHVFVTPRALDGEGFAAKRNRELDRAETAMQWRYEWPRIQNGFLERAGETIRVTATARKDDAIATRDETVQGVARTMELRGEPTRAREIAAFNQVHNDTIRLAAAEQGAAQDASEPAQERQEPEPGQEGTLQAVHAQAQAQAASDEPDGEAGGKERRIARVAAWWHNMRQSFSEWRGQVGERVSDYWQQVRREPDPPEPSQSQSPPQQEPDHDRH